MAISPLAGKHAPAELLINVELLRKDYLQNQPDVNNPQQLVSFGTSGHRGTSTDGTFTETHILAITQAIVDYRRKVGIDGPLFMGKDTHALSTPGPVDGVAGAGGEPASRSTSPPTRGTLPRPPSAGSS